MDRVFVFMTRIIGVAAIALMLSVFGCSSEQGPNSTADVPTASENE